MTDSGADLRAVVFDVNGTLVDIRTDDDGEAAFRAVAHVLNYAGIDRPRHQVRAAYLAEVDAQRTAGAQEHPEFDAVAAWAAVVERHATAFTRALPPERRTWLPLHLAETYRAVSRRRLRPFPHVREVLDALSARVPLAVVTDGQSAWARAELHHVGLADYFAAVVVSGDVGYRKPDARLFHGALEAIGVAPEHALYVGNDPYRDVHGAAAVGMRTALFAPGRRERSPDDVRPDHVLTDHRALLSLAVRGTTAG